MKNLVYIVSFCLGMCFLPLVAQETEEINQDELGNVTDEFQELFFKAIKLRAIENYSQAIETLNKCINMNASEATVYVELGKNYRALEAYGEAEENFKMAIKDLEHQPKLQTQTLLFEVLKSQKKYDEAATLAQVLIANGVDFNLELIEVYMQAKAYKKAIEAIENVEADRGFSTLTDNYRDAIFNSTSNYNEAVAYYKKRISANPLNEDTYFRLINFYRIQGNSSEILATAKALELINPLHNELPFVLSVVYLQENEPDKAFAYSRKVLSNNALDEQVKTQLIQAIKKYVANHPEYQSEFLALLNLAIEEGESSASNEERAEFYLSRDEAKSLEYYIKALEDQPNNFELHQKVILLQLKQNLNEEALATAEEALSFFPAQAVFYYLKGKALAGLIQYDEAISVVEEGLTYIFETSQLEIDMLRFLTKTYFQKGNNDKSEEYSKKMLQAQELLQQQQN